MEMCERASENGCSNICKPTLNLLVNNLPLDRDCKLPEELRGMEKFPMTLHTNALIANAKNIRHGSTKNFFYPTEKIWQTHPVRIALNL